MSWIQDPIILEGERVILTPLQRAHFPELITAAKNPDIWTYNSYNGLDEDILIQHLIEALSNRTKELEYPFVVIDKGTSKAIGTTRYMNIKPEHRNLEIGWTWYNPDYWSKGYNEECKLLLLQYAFEMLAAVRVQLVAWEMNLRSRKAIERIGGVFEGILRNMAIRNGMVRTIAMYSIIPEEWKDAKLRLETLKRTKYDKHRDEHAEQLQ